MRQYELAIRIAQVHHLVDERKYKKALAVIQTLDMRQVRSLSDLKVFAEVYTRTDQYEAAKATYLRIYRRSKTRRVLYRLIYLSIRTNALDDAESYYQEFVRMNPNARDALILRYRIDKAAGVPIGQLIEILQELKQEEYIEEWAYELAKLYHRAGRREECLEECEDILLWFGSGEIVERAKILIDHLQEKDPIPYYDDKDFTVPKKEEPNPDDTGSLPDLNEFIKERKAQKREEKRAEREARKAERYEEDYEEEEDEEERDIFDDEVGEEIEEEVPVKKSAVKDGDLERKKVEKSKQDIEDDFIDDYSDDDFDADGIDLSQKAKDGIQKLSGLFGFGKRDEEAEEPVTQQKEKTTGKKAEDTSKAEKKQEKKATTAKQSKPEYVPHSQSGTGITQDLAREISAIYEMEHREQLKEKAVTVINEVPNLATNVVDRMTQAIQKTTTRSYIPLDIEEIQSEEQSAEEQPLEEQAMEKQPTGEQPLEEQAMEKQPTGEQSIEKQSAEEQLTGEQPIGEQSAEEQLTEEQSIGEQSAEELKTEKQEVSQTEEQITAEQQDFAEKEASAMTQEEVMAEQQNIDTEFLEQTEKSKATEEEKSEAEILKGLLEEEIHDPEEDTKDLSKDMEKEAESESSVSSELEHYQAPEIPVVETDYMEVPEMSYEDLPTTRALQRSFQDVLHLIAGELDPSHFVLMGDGEERIIGVAKQITRVMKEAGYLSVGRIAKIHAQQLNKMDLIDFRKQLKGNCLLIEEASDLLFPTISKIFSIMEEYYGDFVVILADEGTTLDQLFRFVPVLGRKFKYIIDISNYTEADYK